MAGRMRIGAVEFEVLPVPGATAEAVMRDEILRRGMSQKVWTWDGAQGRYLIQATQNGAVPLPNGLVFFVPRVAPTGAVGRNDAASARLASRFVSEIGADDITGVLATVTQVVGFPHKTLPLDVFAPLQDVCSYVIHQEIDYALALLRNREDDLSGYLCLPNRVSYHHEVTEVRDQVALDGLLADSPRLRRMEPRFLVPAKIPANREIRKMALSQRIRDTRDALANLPDGPGGAVARDNLERKLRQSRTEWDALGRAA
ncbi:hypothetical protein OG2516_12066 [Oceanicola granulosus HTCC2516]|uniref:Uncharacterized protein n=1 Tax=Oceanicola granulosus (strain ATCC BAA-861 / DSM 15982 / KCTC 12143 / HTCC2516) TaxID=314256 RepID=Q2CBB1_OCEGH|nr:hypothetical protein [Oceanicola granulosus]EAR49987.1 hypothetical protein OG2516_12066 [Oceanicola granulosus HTCC2516]